MVIKTTLRLDETLVKEAKRKALEEDKTLQEVIDEALRGLLYKKVTRRNVSVEELTHHALKTTGSIKRADIYKGYLDKKFKLVKNIYNSPLLEMASHAEGKKSEKKKDYSAKIDEYLYGRK